MPDSHTASSDLQSLLSQALELSQQMLQAAEADEWGSLVALEAERAPLLPQLFAGEQLTPELSAVVEQIIAIDQRTMALGEKGRNLAGKELRSLTQGRQATSAYDAVQK